MSTALQTPRLILPPIPRDTLAGALKRPQDLQGHSQVRGQEGALNIRMVCTQATLRFPLTQTHESPQSTLWFFSSELNSLNILKEKVSADICTIDSKGRNVFHVHLLSI